MEDDYKSWSAEDPEELIADLDDIIRVTEGHRYAIYLEAYDMNSKFSKRTTTLIGGELKKALNQFARTERTIMKTLLGAKIKKRITLNT